MSRILFDLEGNGLLPEITKVHCVATVDVDTEERRFFEPHMVAEACTYLAGHTLIAHNGLGYDYPVLEKLHGLRVAPEQQLDTLVLARLIRPDVKDWDSDRNAKSLKNNQPTMGKEFGKHTLRAWGKRLEIGKGDFEGPWDFYSPEMGAYCQQDVETTLALWRYLNPDRHSALAIALEHDTARLCRQITAAGWPFDEARAGQLHGEWKAKKEAIEKALIAEFRGWNETEEFIPKVNNKSRGYVKGVPFTKRWFVPFNPQSRDHVIRALKDRGWVPTAFTDAGKPKLDEEVIEGLAASFTGCDTLVDYLTICKRLGALVLGDQAWLKHVTNGRIHGDYNPMGTITGRAAHYNPNIAQVPKCSSPYGRECRSLWIAPKGWTLVGADMAGLELRCFAHYLAKHDGGAYGKLLLTGDPHWVVVRALGLSGDERDKANPVHELLRDYAKTGMYAMLYGAGDEKMGRIILDVCRATAKIGRRSLLSAMFSNAAPDKKALRKVGAQAKYNVMEGIPGFAQLKRDIAWILETKKTLPGLDKRRLPVRHEHAALNTLLQSAGAILCKRWMVDAHNTLLSHKFKWGWDGDFVFVGWIHDELQIAVRNDPDDFWDYPSQIGEVVVEAARKAGEPYGFRIPLDSAWKAGPSWADTH